MNKLVFVTKEDFAKWKRENDIYSCFTAFDTFVGMITQDEVDELGDIVTVNLALNRCNILPLLNDKQIELFKQAHCCKVYIQEDIIKLTPEQGFIVEEIRAAFRKAIKAGIMFCSNDDKTVLYAFNFSKCTAIMNSDGEPEVWDKEKKEWVRIPEDEVVDVPDDMLEVIDEGVDFGNWGSGMMPWRVRVKQ